MNWYCTHLDTRGNDHQTDGEAGWGYIQGEFEIKRKRREWEQKLESNIYKNLHHSCHWFLVTNLVMFLLLKKRLYWLKKKCFYCFDMIYINSQELIVTHIYHVNTCQKIVLINVSFNAPPIFNRWFTYVTIFEMKGLSSALSFDVNHPPSSILMTHRTQRRGPGPQGSTQSHSHLQSYVTHTSPCLDRSIWI